MYAGREDVDVVVRKYARHIGKQRLPVQRLDLDLHEEHAGLGGGPLHLHDAVRLVPELRYVGAVRPVDRDARTTRDEPEDRIRRYRSAAARQLDPDVTNAPDDNAGIRELGLADLGGDADFAEVVVGVLIGAEALNEFLHHGLRGGVAVAHAGVESGNVGVLEVFCNTGQGLMGHQPLQGQVLFPHGARQQFLAALDRFLAALLAEPLPDLVPGTGALDEVLPVLAGTSTFGLGGEDLHPVAVVEFAVERNKFAVDPRADGPVAHLGVHRVSKVHGRRAGRERHHFALRRED